MRKEFESLKISKKQIVVLAVIICLLCLTGVYFFINNESASIHERKFDELKTIAQMKIERISEWQKSRISEVKLFSQDPFYLDNVARLIKKSNDPNIITDLKKHIFEIKDKLSYSNIFITSTDGKILVSSGGEENEFDKITYQKIDEATKLREVVYTDLFFSPLHNKILYNYIAPVIDNKNDVIAVLVFRIDPSVYLYPLIQFWPTASKSAETVICRREGDSVLFLNELRFHKSSSLNYRIPISMKNVPAVHAVLGNSGVFEGYDYRGVEVVSYAALIPNTSWFMVVKVDHKEMFNDLFIRETSLFLIAGILILLFCGSLIIYYNLSRKKIYKELFLKEKQLREYHEEFKTILFSIGDGVITTDISGRVKLINQTAVELTGWKEKNAVGKPIKEIFKIINERSRKEVENPIKRVLEEGAIVGLANHTLLISKDGRETPISDSGAPIRNEKGEVEGTVLVFRDKTEEHIAEKAILLNESRFQKAEFISKFGYYEINFNSGNVVASKGARKIYGLYGSNLTLAIIKNAVLTEYRTKLDNALFAMIERGEPYDEEFKIKNADMGEIVDVYSHADYDDKDGIMFGIIQDITERKKIQEELSISEQRYRLLFELSPEAIFLHSEGKIIFANPAAAILVGVSTSGDLIDKKIFDFIDEESKEVVIKRLKEQNEGKRVPKLKEKLIRNDGTRIDAEVVAAPFMFHNQLYSIVIVSDITERKKTEKELELHRNHLQELVESRTEEIDIINKELSDEIKKKMETEQLLQESLEKEKELNKLKSRFMSTASHEFRTPLAAVLSSAEMIQRYGKTWSEEKFFEHFQRINNSVEYLTKLMDGVLTLSRADFGKIQFNPQPVDLHLLCSRIIEESQINKSNKHEFVFNYMTEQKNFILDSNQINVILQNLISNSIKYSPEGGKIEFSVISKDKTIQFSIKDEGIGIPKDEISELFEPFHRSSNAVSIKGTGLGLSIVKNAVELLKGNITVESEINKGSTFTVNIPVEIKQ